MTDLAAEERSVRSLYDALIKAWNDRDAERMAALFTEDGNCIGFDGSQLDGRSQIQATLKEIFAHHKTPPYVTKVREIRFLRPEVVLLRSVVGMPGPDGADINPELNAMQSLVAVKNDGRWQIALFQNTPAAFHGRPDLVENLTGELRAELQASR